MYVKAQPLIGGAQTGERMVYLAEFSTLARLRKCSDQHRTGSVGKVIVLPDTVEGYGLKLLPFTKNYLSDARAIQRHTWRV
jgi:hypothetical protein